jgi:hypothetical protein
VSTRRPPRLAIWLLDRLGHSRQNAALAGDLLEEFQHGRSAGWFWRQCLSIVAQGSARHIADARLYLAAVGAGLAAEFAVTWTLWRGNILHTVHGLPAIIAGSSIALCLCLLPVAKRLVMGDGSADLRLLLVTSGAGVAERRKAVKWVSFETFSYYLLSCCIVALFYRRFSSSEFLLMQAVWLCLSSLPAAAWALRRHAATAAAAQESTSRILPWPSSDLRLPLKFGDGTIAVEPATVAESVFRSADPTLIEALFSHAAPLEAVRRAVLLGSAKTYLQLCRDPESEPATPVEDVRSLLREARRRPVFDSLRYEPNRWHRLWRRIAV